MRSVKTTCSEPKAMGAKGSEQGERRPFPQQATGSTKPVVMFASSLDSCLPKRQVILRAWKILPGTKIETYCSFQQLRTLQVWGIKEHCITSGAYTSSAVVGRTARSPWWVQTWWATTKGNRTCFLQNSRMWLHTHLSLWLPGGMDFSPALILWYLPSF